MTNAAPPTSPAPPRKRNLPPLPFLTGRTARQFTERNWLFGRTLAVTIDEDSVQTAVASHFGNRFELLSSEKTYLPSSATHGPNRTNYLCDLLDRFVRSEGKPGHRLVVVLSGLETAYREINLPELRGKDLEDAVHFEAFKALPYPDSDLHYGYRVLGRATRDGRPRLRIGVTGTLGRHLAEVMEPFDRLHLRPSAVWSTQDALTSILPTMAHYHPDDSYALLNVEKQRSEISFYVGGELQFSHLISLGSSFLSNRADLTMYEYFAEALAGEIQNSIDYYTGSHTFSNASKVYIYGNLAYSDEIVSLMGERLGFSFCRFPVESLPIATRLTEEMQTALTISLPVAAGALTTMRPANLLPLDRRRQIERRRIDQRGISGLVGLGLMCGALSFSQISHFTKESKDLSAMQREADSLKASPMFASFDAVQHAIRSEQFWIDRFGAKQSGNTEFLQVLSQITPPSVRLYQYQENQAPDSSLHGHYEAYISGIATETPATPELPIHDFVHRLAGISGVTVATLTRFQKHRALTGRSEIDFQILVKGVR